MQKQFEIIQENTNGGIAVSKFGVLLSGNIEPQIKNSINFSQQENSLKLNEEELLIKPFRILTKATTPYRYFDFQKENVLKEATPLFDGLTVYANHNANVNEWKGYTAKPVWDDKNEPNGINALLVIDKTVDPNLARGVEIKALRSASVTVFFHFEKSHPDLKYYYDHIGEEVDGSVVRFIITKIIRASEVSIVWEGEDPYAKQLTKETKTTKKEEGEKEMKLSLSKDFLEKLELKEGIEEKELETKVLEKIEALEKEKKKLLADAEIGKEYLKSTREKAVSAYKVLKGENFKQEFVDNVILKADLTTAKTFLSEYSSEIEDKVPLTCPNCDYKLTRQSSKETEDKSFKANIEDYKL